MRLSVEVFDAQGRPKANCGRPGASTFGSSATREAGPAGPPKAALANEAAALAPCGWQVLNEVALHRGRSPHLTVVDAFVDGQHLTEAVADGLILATPTGSTAYSLSSGGPIAHPAVDCVLLTPIAPRSLSFRTLLLPTTGEVVLRISPTSRNPGSELSIDGREVCVLEPGEYVKVRKSEFPMPCVMRSQRRPGEARTSGEDSGGRGENGESGDTPGEDDWVADIK